jgi:hypothetical protein
MAHDINMLLERAEAAIAQAKRLADINRALKSHARAEIAMMRKQARFQPQYRPIFYPQNLGPSRVSAVIAANHPYRR